MGNRVYLSVDEKMVKLAEGDIQKIDRRKSDLQKQIDVLQSQIADLEAAKAKRQADIAKIKGVEVEEAKQ